MGLWLARRLVGAVLVVVLVAAVTWLLIHSTRQETFGPIRLSDLLTYLERVFLHLDFDGSAAPEEEYALSDYVRQSVPQDLQLLAGGGLLALLAGFAGGMYCARRPRAFATRALETTAFVFLATPVYVVGLMLLLLFGSGFGLLADLGFLMPGKYVPFSENPFRWFFSMLVPWIVLALPLAAFCLRMTAAVMREVFDEQYIRTAEMKGVDPRTVARRHAMPATASPVLSVTGVSVPILVTNMVLVETVFSIPGVFQDMNEAIEDGNFLLLQAMAVVAGFLVVSASLLVDIALAAIDPRVRLSAPRSSSV